MTFRLTKGAATSSVIHVVKLIRKIEEEPTLSIEMKMSRIPLLDTRDILQGDNIRRSSKINFNKMDSLHTNTLLLQRYCSDHSVTPAHIRIRPQTQYHNILNETQAIQCNYRISPKISTSRMQWRSPII